jgi:hypothetical protein
MHVCVHQTLGPCRYMAAFSTLGGGGGGLGIVMSCAAAEQARTTIVGSLLYPTERMHGSEACRLPNGRGSNMKQGSAPWGQAWEWVRALGLAWAWGLAMAWPRAWAWGCAGSKHTLACWTVHACKRELKGS